MSALSLKIYAQPKDAGSLEKIKKFIFHVEAQDFAAIEAMDEGEALYDVDDILNTQIETSIRDGIVYMAFDSASSLEVEVLVEFLHHLGAVDVEIAAFSSQVGEYFFLKNNDEYLDDYNEAEWKWLQNPRAGFNDEYVVVTGTFEDYDRASIEELIEEQGGNVQQSVNAKTTILVVGNKPGKSKVDKAAALGVRSMGETEFLEKLE
ncbi:BRCT domain-containing protein [Massilia sp. DJPM01]|uniref:BRCT domain-containing protein n=1 Tax=Massilia sp. DJPM01 TaxID=3024404 RepID=UPI00259F4936|nr:BRCT domain-containing protein [Massilia sp. DJPM01]MDM5180010.1 BRCT domain-containing protein [Massilia sp. DJPM01]